MSVWLMIVRSEQLDDRSTVHNATHTELDDGVNATETVWPCTERVVPCVELDTRDNGSLMRPLPR